MGSQLIEQLHQNSSVYWINHKLHEEVNCRCFVPHVKGSQEMLNEGIESIKYRKIGSPWPIQYFYQ